MELIDGNLMKALVRLGKKSGLIGLLKECQGSYDNLKFQASLSL